MLKDIADTGPAPGGTATTTDDPINPRGLRSDPAGQTPSRTLSVVYVGPNMDVFARAYRAVHQDRGHTTDYLPSVADVARLPRPPDVVVINPLVVTPLGVDGACALQAVVPITTTIVAIYTSLGNSHAMYARHALGGRCHPRMLLHYPSPDLRAEDIIGQVDSLARSSSKTGFIDTTGRLPLSLVDHGDRKDLGQVLSENVDQCRSAADSLTFSRLLHAASVDAEWSTWGELAGRLGFAEGHVKNTKARIGRILADEVLPDRSEAGVPERGDRPQTWRIAQFTRFVTEHQSFIRAYCDHHLIT